MSQSEPSAVPNSHLDRFTHPRYVLRRKFFKLLGEAFRIFDEEGNLVLYSKMKAFKLKEDIRLYASEDMSEEVLTITARSIIDFSAAYDVMDPVAGVKVGALRRKGFKSMLRDEWVLLDEHDEEIGTIREDSLLHALARRAHELVALLMPQKYGVELGGERVAEFRQGYNPFFQKIDIDFTGDADARLDRRLGVAAAVLLAAIEGRQS